MYKKTYSWEFGFLIGKEVYGGVLPWITINLIITTDDQIFFPVAYH